MNVLQAWDWALKQARWVHQTGGALHTFLASLLSGEGGVGVTRPLRTTAAVPYFTRAWAGSAALPTDELVKSGPGILRGVQLFHDTNHATTVGRLTITIYDITAASGNILWQGQVVSDGAGLAILKKDVDDEAEIEFTQGCFIDYGVWTGTQPTGGTIQLIVRAE